MHEARDGNLIGALAISTDVTERARTQAALTEQLALIEAQSRAIQSMTAPVIQVWDGVLVMPIVGPMNGERAEMMLERLLDRVQRTSSHSAVLDLTAVTEVDVATGGHLLKIVDALALLGTRSVISGVRPAVAQTLVSLGVDLSRISTVSSLNAALKLCMRAQ